EKIDLLRHQLGLDRPWYLRYAAWLGGLVRGHWGYSYYTGRPVLEMIAERLPATFTLMLSAFILALALSFPLGMLAATHKYSWGDNVLSLGAFFVWAMPTFWFGLMLQMTFAVRWHMLPVAGMHELDNQSGGGPVASPGDAGAGARDRLNRELEPVPAQRHARGAGTGLCPHGVREGAASASRRPP